MEILKYQSPAQTLVQRIDNTYVSRPIIPVKATQKQKEIYEAAQHPGQKKIIINGKSIWVKDKNESVSSEKRPAALVKKHSEEGKAKHDYQKHKEQEEKINQGILGAAALGGLALVQATPAAPYVDAALAAHGGIGLAKQANDGTLGFNTETAGHVLETLPLGIRGGIGMRNLSKKLMDNAYIAWNLRNPKVSASYSPVASNIMTKIGDLVVSPNGFYSQGYNAVESFTLRPTSNRWFSQGNRWDDVIETFNSNKLVPRSNGHFQQVGPLLNSEVNLYKYNPTIGYQRIVLKPSTNTYRAVPQLTDAQWDTLYNIALKSGNMDEVQRLRDMHFIANGGEDNTIFAHTTKAKFNTFDKSHFGETDEGFNGKGFYFSTTRVPENSSLYSTIHKGPHGEIPTMNYGPNKIYAYLKGNREFNIGNPNRNFFKEPNTVGITGKSLNWHPHEVIIGNSRNIKLADAVTYDDAGNIIPLSKRDNFNISDIRYGFLPFVFGGSTATSYILANKNASKE